MGDVRGEVSRMSRAALEAEVLSARMRRVAGGRSSQELLRARAETRSARKAADSERALRKAAEANALRFHALMLKARIELITRGSS